jgi:chloramphenicol 3-O-phosphotransferase
MIIIHNGTSSSCKSTITQALQHRLGDRLLMHPQTAVKYYLEMSVYLGETNQFTTKINTIQQEYRRLSSFMQKLYEYKLVD